MLIIEEIADTFDVYDITVQDNHNFYANDILVHNCQEILLSVNHSSHQEDGLVVDRFVNVPVNQIETFNTWLETNDLCIEGQTFGTTNEIIHKCSNLPEGLDIELSVTRNNKENYKTYKIPVELVFGEVPAEIALCTLAAVNLGKIKEYTDFERVCKNIRDTLDWVIDKQEYPIPAAKKMLKRRSIGVGLTNFAYWIAKKGFNYEDPNALYEIDKMMEYFTYYCLKANNDAAKEKGKCEWYHKTNYAKDILVIDTYNKNVDLLVNRPLECDWDKLRNDIKLYGMRHTTNNAMMPVDSCQVLETKIKVSEPIFTIELEDGTFKQFYYNDEIPLTNGDFKLAQYLVQGDDIII
jgi:ribonucleotide reductase alpha subunit